MIKITFKGPKPGVLLRAATAAIEKDLESKAKAAANRPCQLLTSSQD